MKCKDKSKVIKCTMVFSVNNVNVSQQLQHLQCYTDLASSFMLLSMYIIFPSPKSTTAMPWKRTLEMTTRYSLSANSEYTVNKSDRRFQVKCIINNSTLCTYLTSYLNVRQTFCMKTSNKTSGQSNLMKMRHSRRTWMVQWYS